MDRFMSQFGQSFSFSDDAALFMYAIAIFGAIALAIGIERFYYIMVRSNVNSDKFMAEIRKLVAGGNQEARSCRSADGPVRESARPGGAAGASLAGTGRRTVQH